ncbi:discoidin domain-containing protein [Hymenobacter sp. B81]|uniref:discoidin domain-containing protein n=1 Tax=Hymenobacter sp. B81 TaxID=3344878 RepID=UPI0037DCFBA0
MHLLHLLLRQGWLRLVWLLAAVAALSPLAAQTPPNLDRVEYFIDTDPGHGSATAVTLPASPSATLANLTFPVSLSAISPGFHNLFIRSRAVGGAWSQTSKQLLYVGESGPGAGPVPALNRLEYFIDTDPGHGSATAVTLPGSPGTALSNFTFAVPLSSVGGGFHALYIRSRDANGGWSQTQRRIFYVEPTSSTAPPANLTALEYFVDTDPGHGNATSAPIAGGGTNATGVSFSVGLGALSSGFHTLYYRTRDAAGKWSQTQHRIFYVDDPNVAAAPNITKAEYFFDTDPGYGSGVNIAIATPAPVLSNLNILADATALADGEHRLYVRSRDANGRWSMVIPGRVFRKNGCAVSSNLAAGLPAASYSQSGSSVGSAEQVFNGGSWTYSTNNDYFVRADLGTPRTISEVRMTARPSTATNGTVRVETSTNLNTWTTQRTFTGPFTNGQELVASFDTAPIANVRGVRVVVNWATAASALEDVSVYNFDCPAQPPIVSSFTPSGGSPGTVVTLTGQYFTGATAVTFNGVAATAFTVNSATQLTVTAPAAGTSGQICVTTPGGTGCSAASYTFPPTIAVGTVSPTPLCAGVTLLLVPFTTNTTAYAAGNQFKFQLSDANGVFTAGSRLYGTLISSSATGGTLRDSVALRTPPGSGYRVRVVASNPAIVSPANAQDLTINATPLTQAGSNSPVTFGNTIALTAGPAYPGATYQWSGPAGFSSTQQNPQRTGANPGMSGRYTVTVTLGGCTYSAFTDVSVLNAPTPVITLTGTTAGFCPGTSNAEPFSVTVGTLQGGNTLTLQLSDASGSFATPVSVAAIGYSGQGNGSIGFSLPTGTAPGSGYLLRLVSSNPAVTSNTRAITVRALPTAQATSNSPVVYGGTLQLNTPTVANATYQWSGPAGFSSTQQNPQLPNATPSNSGTYSLTVTGQNGCTAQSAVAVTVQAPTQPLLSLTSFGGTYCAGAASAVNFTVNGLSFAAGNVLTAQLSDASGSFATPVAIGTVAFAGQGSGSVSITLPDATPFGTGYRIRLVGSNPAVTSTNDNGQNLTINPLPAAVASSNSPVVTGNTLQLSAQTVAGATYQWTGPASFSSTQQNPQILNATPANAGTYNLLVRNPATGCLNRASVTVQVQGPVATVLTLDPIGPLQLCAGNSFPVQFSVTGGGMSSGNVVTAQLSEATGLFTAPVNVGSTAFTGTGNGQLTVAIPLSTPTGSGYRLRLVSSAPALTSATNASNWQIYNLSAVSVSSNSPVPVGGTLQLTAQGVPSGLTGQWTGPGGFSAAQNSAQLANFEPANAGSYVFTLTTTGCTVAYPLTVQLQPTVAVGAFGGTLCPGSGVSVPFTAQGSYSAGNLFRAVLSAANGSFASGTVIGTLALSGTGPLTGTIAATLPAGTALGTGYRIRVEASNPALVSTNTNGSDLTVQALSFVWTGGTSTAWTDGRNWSCGQAPNSSSNVVVAPAAFNPMVSLAGNIRSLTVNAGATVTMTAPLTLTGDLLNQGTMLAGTGSRLILAGSTPQTLGGSAPIVVGDLQINAGATLRLTTPLRVAGNWLSNGSFEAGTALVTLNGSSPQSLSGSTPPRFYDLQLANPAGARCSTNVQVSRLLTLTQGNLVSDGFLTLRSTAAGTAMVVNPVGGGLVTGRATMERFITGAGSSGYRHYASPMQLGSATVSEFADDLPVFELNPAYNTQGNTVSPFPTFFQYNEARLNAAAGFFDQGWLVPAATDNLLPLRGYSAQTNPTTTVDISGVLQNGSVSIPLTRGGQAGSGWNLLGNPYPAPIDWDLVPASPGVDKALYVFVPSGPYTGAYQSYVNGIGQNGGSKDVAAMQGFFVRATAASATLSLSNAVRHTSYLSPAFNRTGPNGPAATAARPLLRLEARNAQGQADEAVLYFEPQAGQNYQPGFDAYKVQLNGNGRPSLWSQAGNDALSINGLPALSLGQLIPLGLRVSQPGSHTLVATELLNLPAGTQMWLEDRELGRYHNLSQVPSYAFTMAPSYAGQRFFLWLGSRPTATTAAALQAATRLYPNPTNTGRVRLEVDGLREQRPATVQVLNVIGQVVHTLTVPVQRSLIRQELDLGTLPAGVYSVRIYAAEGVITQRLIRE